MAIFPALFGLLLTTYVSGQVVEITPLAAVRREGDDLTVLCKVPYPIDSCRIQVGKTSYRLLPNNLEGDVVYSGRGLQDGECGAHMKRVLREWNGEISCTLPPRAGSIELTASMNLTVAKAPEHPILLVPQKPFFSEGDQLNAQCIVKHGRPAAKISWFIDDQPLLSNLARPVSVSEGDSVSVSQNATLTLSADEGGRALTCRADHEALDTPMQASQQIVVYYPPRRADGSPSSSLTVFGLALGARGALNVTVRAAPAPRAHWAFSATGAHIGSGGEYTALQPIALGNGYYNLSLVIAEISMEHVEQTYSLRVENDVGSQEYTLRISTMEQPAGVELDAGAIVGIVVGVVVLVAAVALVVFAKATDRWCFAGSRKGREQPDGSGESSSTEGAAPAPTRLQAIRALFSRCPPAPGKLRAAGDAARGDDKSTEEKKGVVYAELALGEQPTGEKPPPPSTEYAEIVYSEQKETKQ